MRYLECHTYGSQGEPSGSVLAALTSSGGTTPDSNPSPATEPSNTRKHVEERRVMTIALRHTEHEGAVCPKCLNWCRAPSPSTNRRGVRLVPLTIFELGIRDDDTAKQESSESAAYLIVRKFSNTTKHISAFRLSKNVTWQEAIGSSYQNTVYILRIIPRLSESVRMKMGRER